MRDLDFIREQIEFWTLLYEEQLTRSRDSDPFSQEFVTVRAAGFIPKGSLVAVVSE